MTSSRLEAAVYALPFALAAHIVAFALVLS